MRLLIQSVIPLVTIFFASASATAAPTCYQMFSQGFDSPRLIQTSSAPGLSGGNIMFLQQKTYVKTSIFLKKTTLSYDWFDYKINPDKSGDVRWAAAHLPFELKNLLSIRAYDHRSRQLDDAMASELKTLSLPDLTETNHVVNLLTKEIQKTQPDFKLISFYPANEIVSGRTYIQNFATKAALPLATQGHLFEHDFNYHFLSSLITPVHFLKALQNRAELVLLFADFAKENAPHYKNLRKLNQAIETRLLAQVTSRLDLLGNLFTYLIVDEKTIPAQQRFQAMQKDIDRMVSDALSPKIYLDQIIEISQLGPDLDQKMFLNDFNKLYDLFIQQLPSKYLQNDLELNWLQDARFVNQEAHDQLQLLNKTAGALNSI